MASKLYSVHHWHRGALLAAVFNCREAVATEIKRRQLPAAQISELMAHRLYQHASSKPTSDTAKPIPHHGWEGGAASQVNLGTVTDPRTGEEVVFVPKRRAMSHQHASAGRLYEVLRDYERRYFGLSSQRSAGCHDTDAPWHRLVDQGDVEESDEAPTSAHGLKTLLSAPLEPGCAVGSGLQLSR